MICTVYDGNWILKFVKDIGRHDKAAFSPVSDYLHSFLSFTVRHDAYHIIGVIGCECYIAQRD